MGYLPIFLELGGRPCLVVGGGEAAERKVRALLGAGAEVTIVSPVVTASLAAMARNGAIRHLTRSYQRRDVAGFALVHVATDDSVLNREIAAEARSLGISVNVADCRELSSFITPSVIRRGALQIAISTGGASPALARRLREQLESQFGPEYDLLLDVLRAARRHLYTHQTDRERRTAKLSALAASSDLREALRRCDLPAVERILASHLGPGVGMAELGLTAVTELDSMIAELGSEGRS
jgi:precorrin-2 dehydrogenase/sirohydrochlorin ferrochelatase